MAVSFQIRDVFVEAECGRWVKVRMPVVAPESARCPSVICARESAFYRPDPLNRRQRRQGGQTDAVSAHDPYGAR